ncbi:MAG: transposase [Pseudomonadales bacterium]
MKKRPNYSDEFKTDAVKLVVEQGYSASEAARNLGVSASALRRWVKDHREETMSIPEIEDLAQAQATIKEQVKRLKRLEMEREILKKAAAFFANEPV